MKKNLLFTSLIIFVSLTVFPFNNYALDNPQDEASDELKLYLGEVKIVPVQTPTRIVIGNPSIADVSGVTTSEITLSPKAVGTTNLVFWDSFGEQSYRVIVAPENMDAVKRRVDGILAKLEMANVYTQTADEEGKILLLGKVKTAQEKERINTALGTLKDKLVDLILVKEEESAVEIDVHVLEVDKDSTTKLGFTWPGSSTITISEAVAPSGVAMSRLFTVGSLSRAAFSWTIDALVKEGKARILSRPRLACQSGKEAVLLVGGEKPIMTTEVAATTGAQGTNVEYKEFGIKLKIKPTVTETKQIKLALGVEISEVGDVLTLGTAASPTAKAYPLTKRNASTELFLNDGQTMAIGGLIKQKTDVTVQKVPFLGDIPIIGMLFRYKETKTGGGIGERGNTELFITLTPTIIGAPKETDGAKLVANTVSELAVGQLPQKKEEKLEVPLEYMRTMGYASIIQKRILEILRYPAAAKESGFQGTVVLKLHLSYLGELMGLEVKSSSGYNVLDDNAISVVKDIATYPPFPPAIEKKDLWIEVPIVYRLD